MITLSIDVTKLDKTRFKNVVKRDGTKAVYAELVLIETPNSEYGDFIVKQSVTKEERAARKEMPILGNAKNFGHSETTGTRNTAATAKPNAPTPAADDDVPF